MTVTVDQLAARVGEEVGISRWFPITQAMIDAHADTTLDHQFIHTDPARAKAETPFGGTIAHGFLTLSMVSAMAYDALPDLADARIGVNYGFNKLRFVAPVPAGTDLRARFTLTALDRGKPGEVTLTWDVTIEIKDHERPALVAEWITRRYLEQTADLKGHLNA
ncbi:MaoC family dehydratase [Actibacterium sp. 188UL27-1]|uniref:MaoC family dehydratase n=1 Tax=Actibacterium sp. 188UL27-1 TaxID=2786961 RepID=UPI00195C9EC9|nr:MaoC family dehydratase [Actibacterium sp. 188UL27-1]MBM7069634.1 MaoC family dehydratase [Actibacterium sp. 188UL27-1]